MQKIRKFKKEVFVVTVLSLLLVLLTVIPALSQVTGPCVDCHTMHNSQDGASMATTWNGSAWEADPTPNAKLLRRDGCLGCHSGSYTAGAGLDGIPKVLSLTNAPAAGQLSAGGNFYWVAQPSGDVYGHNVGFITTHDPNFTDSLNFPPGFSSGYAGPSGTERSGMTVGSDTAQLTCAGVNGCHGDPSISGGDFASLAGAHHGVELANGFSDGSDIAKSYRFLYGIKGVEDDDWEYTVSSTDHNQYSGEVRTSNTSSVDTTITHLCCECHGVFHAAADTAYASPWIRHPTDFDLSDATGTEYAVYNGGDGTSDNPYSPVAPVAADMTGVDGSTAAGTMVVSNILSAPAGLTGKVAIVTCISCHRAHGSEYADLLRWDYDNISAASGAGNVGCFICHTTKDDNM